MFNKQANELVGEAARVIYHLWGTKHRDEAYQDAMGRFLYATCALSYRNANSQRWKDAYRKLEGLVRQLRKQQHVVMGPIEEGSSS